MMRPQVRPAWAIALAGVFVCAVTPGTASAQRRVRVSTVEILPRDAAIQVGQQQVFVPVAYDAANSPVESATFTFTSSNVRVATIDRNGIATGVSAGTATITARTGTGAAARSAQATLAVSAARVPPIDRQGQPSGQAPPAGEVRQPTPAATAGGVCALEPAGSGPAEGVVVRPLRATLVRGESQQLEYRSVRGTENAECVPIVFSVAPGGERVVSVDSVGLIRAMDDTGSATVRLQFPRHPGIPQKQVLVVVTGDTVRFVRDQVWMSPGEVDTLQIGVPAQRRVLDVRGQFQFTTSDSTAVQVAPLLPVVEAVAPGSARITGESGYHSLSVQVSVHRQVTHLSATPVDSSLTIAMSSTQRFAIQALASDSTPVSEAPLRWTLPNAAVAAFDTATMTMRGVRMGETGLAVASRFRGDSVLTRSWRIRVVAGGLSVSRARVGLGVGERFPVEVRLLDDRRNPIGPATGLAWTSSNDSVARVVDGRIVGVGVGHARLTARAPWDSTVHVEAYVAGQVLVAAQRGGRWDLFEMTADSVPRFVPVTANAAVEMEPAWAPDLTRIAYVSAPPENPSSLELYVVDADGSEPRRLTFDSATVKAPVFVRPAGDRIVFQSNRGGRAQLYVVNLDGTGRRALTTGESPNMAPDVSPDGTKVLFVSLRQAQGASRNYDIWQMDLDGATERRLTSNPRNEDAPQFAADGRSFFFLRDEAGSPPTKRLYRQSLTDTTAAAEPITPVGMFVNAFSVSADGALIALSRFESFRGVGNVPRVVLLQRATGTLVNVQLAPGEQLSAPVFRPATPRP